MRSAAQSNHQSPLNPMKNIIYIFLHLLFGNHYSVQQPISNNAETMTLIMQSSRLDLRLYVRWVNRHQMISYTIIQFHNQLCLRHIKLITPSPSTVSTINHCRLCLKRNVFLYSHVFLERGTFTWMAEEWNAFKHDTVVLTESENELYYFLFFFLQSPVHMGSPACV